MSITLSIVSSYRRPRDVFRGLLAQGRREDRALMYLMVSCLLLFAAQWPRLMREAESGGEVPFQALVAGALFGWLFLAPLFFFAVAAVLHLMLRGLRRSSTWHGARMVLFWSLLAISPAMLFHGLLLGYAGPGPGATVVGFVVLGAFLYILAQGLRELAAGEAG